MQTAKEIFIVPDHWNAEVIVEHPFFVEYQRRIYQGIIKATRGNTKELYNWGTSWVGPSPDFRKTPAEKEISKIDPNVPIDVNSFAEDIVDEVVCHLISPETNPYPKKLASFIPDLKVSLGNQDVAAHTWYIFIPADAIIGERVFRGQVQVGYDSFMYDNVAVCFMPWESLQGSVMAKHYFNALQESSQMAANVFLEKEIGTNLFTPGQQIGRTLLDYIRKRRVK